MSTVEITYRAIMAVLLFICFLMHMNLCACLEKYIPDKHWILYYKTKRVRHVENIFTIHISL